MVSRSWIAVGLVSMGLFVNTMTWTVKAGEQDHKHSHWHKHPRSTQATPHTMEQAGYPQEVSMIATESYGPHYSPGYVGGGKHSFFGGYGRCGNAGTWGMDYTPFSPMSSRIFLNWSHGRLVQGGYGAYRTDGPKPLEHITEAIHGHFGGGE